MWLQNTIDDALKNFRGDSRILVNLDGNWPLKPIPDHPKVVLVHHTNPIGQRAGINLLARMSTANYIAKADAHCAFDEGFDVKLMEPYESGEISLETTTIPRMYNLHCHDWMCDACGNRTYQGPTPQHCVKCNHPKLHRELVWQPRWSRRTDFARFDSDLHFQYWRAYKNRPAAKGDIADVLSSVGAMWMMPRRRFKALGGLDEGHGSWGQMGTEIACKSWLSGGRQVVNKRTWFSHMFRTQGKDFGFPYPLSGKEIAAARAHSRKLWIEGKWKGTKYPLRWLLEKFWPVEGWEKLPD